VIGEKHSGGRNRCAAYCLHQRTELCLPQDINRETTVTGDSHHSSKTSVRLANDVRAALETWAEYNLSSLTAELNKSVRQRMQAERKETEGAAD
jgi:hypothetical protein